MKGETYQKLNPIERQLRSSLLSNYARLSAAEFEGLFGVYKELFGVELTRNERNCNVCRLKAIKKIANEYFQYQEWYKGRWGRRPEDPKEEISSAKELSNPKPEGSENNNSKAEQTDE